MCFSLCICAFPFAANDIGDCDGDHGDDVDHGEVSWSGDQYGVLVHRTGTVI